MDSLPLICCLVGCFILVVPFTILVIYLVNKGKKSAWKGKIVDKLHKISRDDDNDQVDYYSLVVETEDNKSIKVGVSLSEYNSFKIGDKLIKESGKFKPTKVV